jgi:hypothetical protein
MSDQSMIGSIGTAGQDPDGFRYPWIEMVTDDSGKGTSRISRGRTLGAVVDTDRTLHPGDLVTFRCRGGDPYGRSLRWWIHPSGGDKLAAVKGDSVELSWMVDPVSVGRKVYVGIGMAADSRYHREGALYDQGYDGWIVFYYRVVPSTVAVDHPSATAPVHRPYGWDEWEESWQRFVSRSIGWYRES